MYNQLFIRAAPQKKQCPFQIRLSSVLHTILYHFTLLVLRTHSQFLYTSAFSNDTPAFLGESKFAWNSRVPSDVSIYKQ